ncbi:Non-classical phosphatidylinositol transfer protein (PITP) [Ascosphaera atra]|nr:Non-classical phosphatidylinositol transfer protein (PITP) [Ascosphaera atra]
MADADKGKAPQVEAPQLDEQATTSQAQEQAQPQPDLEHNPDFQKETEGNAPSEASSEDAPALEPVEQTGETSQSAQQQEPEQGQEEGKEQEPAQPEAQEAAKEDDKPEYIKSQPRLEQFFQSLPSILEKSGHNEMWGVTLSDWHHIPTVNVLVKYIRANDGNLDLAKEQLLKALKWRKSMSPLSLVDEVYATKFQGLGYLTKYKTSSGQEEVFSWNIYGSVAKNIKETFGDAEA